MRFVSLLSLVLFVASSNAARAITAATKLRATILTPSSLNLSWQDNSTDETGYLAYVQRLPSLNQWPYPLTNAPANTTNLLCEAYYNNITGTNLTLGPGSTNKIIVQVLGASGHVDSTNITVVMPALNAPGNLTASILNPTTVNLSWKDNSTNETYFVVYYRVGTNGGFTIYDFNGFNEGVLLPNTTNFIARSLAPATMYQFAVENYFDQANRADSSVITVTTPTFIAPSNLTATVMSPASVKLTWKDNSTNEASFLVNSWRQNVSSVNGDGSPVFSAFPGGSLALNSTNFTATGLAPGDTYKFMVQTIVGTNISASTNSATVMVTLPGPSSRVFHPAVVGQAIAPYTVTATESSGTADSIGVSGLPPGLVFDAGSSQVNGVPTQGGVFTATMTTHYATWGNINKTLIFRVIYPPGAPAASAPIPKQTVNTNGAIVSVALNSFFTDPDTEKAVRFVTTKGTFDVALYATATPQTVSNFLNYMNRGDYNDTVVHRAPFNFVVQGGGYRTNDLGFLKIPTDPSPTNEPGVQQIRGTIAMAKLGGQPSSATDEWFFNFGDNSSILDDQSGGFTAFGRIIGGGTGVIDEINNLPRQNYTVVETIGTNVFANNFDNVPVDDFSAPPEIDLTKLVYVQSVTPITPLTYSIGGNTAPALINASINGGNLMVNTGGHLGGAATLTITATDLDGNNGSQSVVVEINTEYSAWLNQFSLTNASSLPAADPDGDGVINAVEFALGGNPNSADAASTRPTNSIVTVSTQQFLALTFKMRTNLSGATVLLRGNSQLATNGWTNVWTSAGLGASNVVSQTSQGAYWLMTVRDAVPISTGGSQRFLNLQVQTPP
ncbi:MAG TPA: peptidylprolyl isomerase [Verrucomicrobiae bacterium]|jgi:cyclophilin family peptidyl-prolyl cis-trans isomerase